jgi:uncharacterized protein (DUF2384 family)
MTNSKSSKEITSPVAIRRRDLFLRGKEVFGTEEKFEAWLSFYRLGLGSVSLSRILSSKKNYTTLLNCIGRIEHGIFA